MTCRLWRWCVQAVFQRRCGVWAICLPIDMRSTVSSTEEEQEDLFGRESSVCQMIVILFVVYKYKHRCYLCTIHFQSSHTSPNNNVKTIVVNEQCYYNIPTSGRRRRVYNNYQSSPYHCTCCQIDDFFFFLQIIRYNNIIFCITHTSSWSILWCLLHALMMRALRGCSTIPRKESSLLPFVLNRPPSY